jgi:peptide/nickel transport system substrate-binding protein
VIEPDLAESLPSSEIVDGKQIWTFKLRREVMFHPGPKTTAYVLTADDVVYSLYKSADPTHSAYAGEFGGMTFARVDDYTVRIILEKPLSSILFLPRVANYAGGFIVSRKAVEAMGQEAFNSHPVGTGPFIFDSWTPEKKIRLVANRRYFRGSPLVDAVEVCYLPDIGSRERGLRAGQLDVIEGPQTTAWVKKMEQEQDIHVDVFGVGEVETIHFNATVQPLDDVRARRAIAHALDRKELLALLGERICGSVYSPVPSQFLPGGLTEHEVQALGLDYAPDLEKARQLLAEAGHPRGFSLEVSTSAMDAYLKSSECIKAQLARIGIDLKLKVVDHSTMHKMIRRDVNPLVIYIAWRPNADAFLTRFFHSDSIVVTGPKPDTNFSHYDKIDRLIEAGRLEINSSKQIELWKHAQIKVLEDLVAYPLLYINLVYARRAGVDYGHELISSMALYPQITEKTRMVP